MSDFNLKILKPYLSHQFRLLAKKKTLQSGYFFHYKNYFHTTLPMKKRCEQTRALEQFNIFVSGDFLKRFLKP